MPLDVLKEVVFQVLKKITVEDGDILVVRCDPKMLSDLVDIMSEVLLDKRVLLVLENEVEFLGEVEEETMNRLGWYRKENDEDSS